MKRFFWPVLALGLGFLVPLSGYYSASFLYDRSVASIIQREKPNVAAVSSQDNILAEEPPAVIPELRFQMPEKGRAIRADLSAMSFEIYEDGRLLENFKILSIGRKGMPWETPVGKYKVITKEEKHYSSIGNVWMPFSVQFFGNFFVHGWPYYPDGALVPKGFSGGCIRLSTSDAEKVFNFAENDMPFYVVNGSLAGEFGEPLYFLRNKSAFPKISASAFLVADLDNELIIKENKKNERLPIASVTKLMTALVSLETINQYSFAAVSKSAVATYGDTGDLREGEEIRVSSLIYPLLLESSNDAAMVLAEQIGTKKFVDLMNEKAVSLSLAATSFKDPSGLTPENLSTAEDLFLLTQYLYKNKNYILETTKKRMAESADNNGKNIHTWYNVSKFIYDKRFLGGKTGYTTEAMETAVALFSLPLSEFENKNIAIVVLSSESRENDIFSILKWLESDVVYSEKFVPSADNTKLLFAGDIMLDRGVYNFIDKIGLSNYSFSFLQSGFIKDADVAFANLEGPISGRGKNSGSVYSFRFNTAAASALADAGFDVLSVANNHIADWGEEALEDTLKTLTDNKILAIGGGGKKEEAVQPKIIERSGVKIGFLGFSDVGPDWLEATGDKAGVLIVRDDDFSSIIREAARKTDVLVISIHFGEEYQTTPTKRQKTLAREAIDAGAKIVIGHHPHVIQDLEYYKGGVIAYSLGNFVFDQNFSDETMRGLVLEIILKGRDIVSVSQRKIKINNFFQPELAE